MVTDKEPIILRSRCGLHRYVLVEPGAPEFRMPLLPYKRSANMDYYTKNIPEGTKFRTYVRTAEPIEWGAYSEKCAVFLEKEESEDVG
jgi:hypothetical protein